MMYRGGPYGIAGGGVWEQFPYANFHEWNMDFILRKLKTLEGRMALLDERMNSLEADMSELRQKMQQLREAMAALILKVEALETDLEGAVNRITVLEADMSAAVSRISALEDGMNNLQSALDSLNARVITVEASISNIYGTLTQALDDIGALTGKMNDAESKIAWLENDSKVKTLSNKFTQNGSVDNLGRSVYETAGIVSGTFRFTGWTGTAEHIVIDASDLAAPGYGTYYSVIEGVPDSFLQQGWIGPHSIDPKRGEKNYILKSKPENIVEMKETKGGGYYWNIPDEIRDVLIADPAKSVVIVFTYTAVDREV